ncbi:hypothetical protein BBJ28_00007606, partial [Nothophytophthora sp. Chile5]
ATNMWEELVTTRGFWAAVLAFRLWNALFVRSSFNPDEYWQSTEVAHRLVFGYGYMCVRSTWEWQDDAQLRGFAHPALFAGLYKLLEVLLARTYFDPKSAKWALLCHLFSWFIFYVMVRPFSNSIETVCTTAALAYWPWNFLQGTDKKKDATGPTAERSNRTLALVLAALGVLFRPTNIVVWLYPGAVHLVQTHDRAHLIFGIVLPIALATAVAMLCIDRLGYGEWTFVPFNFFKFNILEVKLAFGKDKLYGEHPWSWYFSQGFPAIVGTSLPLAIAGYLTVPFRFVLPLLPPAFVYAGYCLRNLENKLYAQFRERTQWNLLRLAVFTVVVPNLVTAYYLSRVHQVCPLSVSPRVGLVVGTH